MAMCTTIVSIREKNIRHLYYGQPNNMLYRTSGDYPNLDQLRIAKGDKELREAILKSAKQNYTPAELEPAPSFRCVSAAKAEEIGNRLYAGHRSKTADKDQKTGKSESDVPTRKSTNSRGDVVSSSKRLHRELPYTAQVRYSKDPVRFIGRHKHVHDVAQLQKAKHWRQI